MHHDCLPQFPVGQFIYPTILDPSKIRKYISALKMPPKLKPKCQKKICYPEDGKECFKNKSFYSIEMVEVKRILHPDIPPTKLWLYRDPCMGDIKDIVQNPLIETETFNPVVIKWINNLPTQHLFEEYIDRTLDGTSFPAPDVRNIVHMHGGAQSPSNDGAPYDWYTPGQYKIFTYPALEPATMLFWHDHALGITRLNVYAGLTGGIYILRDQKEMALNLPRGKYEIPLVITDRTFDTEGQSVFSTSNISPRHPRWNSAFLGNTICVNNQVWPYLKVEQNKYRFRIVNGSDTRTYSIKLMRDGMTNAGPAFYQIGSDAGFLPKPIKLNDPNMSEPKELILAIAERADVIIDFSAYPIGTEFIMVNTANEPFPGGPLPDPETVGQIMKFIVTKTKKCHDFSVATPACFDRINPAQATVLRQLLLEVNREMDMARHPNALYLNNLGFHKPVSERPLVYSTEIWELINLTNGMHPIHIHLIDFQLLNTQAFDSDKYSAALKAANPHMEPGEGIENPVDVTPFLIGNPESPRGTNQDAWKDVIQAAGNKVTRIIMSFSPRTISGIYPFDPTAGAYMWHCHILSHEDNDMMRPMQLCRGKNDANVTPLPGDPSGDPSTHH